VSIQELYRQFRYVGASPEFTSKFILTEPDVSAVVPTDLPELSLVAISVLDDPSELRVLPVSVLETALPLSEETVEAFTVLLVAEIEPAFTVFA